jgi:Cohesin domain
MRVSGTMKRHSKALGLIGILGAALLFAAGLWTATDTSAAPGATVRLLPSSQNVEVGDTLTLDVTIDNTTNLAAFEFRINYDPNILKVTSVNETDFLSSTGRGAGCPPIADEAASKTTDVWFGCATTNKSSGPPVNGSGTLAQVTFSAIGPGLTNLTFVKLELADDMSNDCCAPVSISEAAVRVIGTDEPTPESLPPTPTRNPTAMTPTPNPAGWVPLPGPLLPSAEERARGGTSGSDGTANGTTGASGDSQGTTGGSPRAGEGPPQNPDALWPAVTAAILAAGGMALLSLAFYTRRAYSRRRSGDEL